MISDSGLNFSFPILLYRISYSTIFCSSNIFFLCYHNMHKSELTFGFLMSLLIMLAAMPFLNEPNSFSNTLAMAQEYDNYDDNKYNPYPTDDKQI